MRKEVRDPLEDIGRRLHDTRLVVGDFTGLIQQFEQLINGLPEYEVPDRPLDNPRGEMLFA